MSAPREQSESGKRHYVRRDNDGRFRESDDVGKSSRSGRSMDVKQDGKPFKGVAKEPDGRRK